MKHNLLYKLGAIALLIVLLLIPLLMIGSVIGDRQRLRDSVVDDIARSSTYSQQLTGPVLVVPYSKTVREWKERGEEHERYLETKEVSGRLYFLPDTFNLDGKVVTELRSRGIYEARLFHADNVIDGDFQLPAKLGIGDDYADYHFQPAFLAIGISDIRGIENGLKMQLNEQKLDFEPGSNVSWLGEGVHVPLPIINGDGGKHFTFAFNLRLQGTGSLQITPVGRNSDVKLSANWPNPSFVGNYLPSQRHVDDNGFTAEWRTSFFSTNLEDVLAHVAKNQGGEHFSDRSFGVSFIEPVDQYLKSDRAIKYALLFIALTFAGFFLVEVLKSISVHPIQYALVGTSLALFFLLLLSLAEHVGFGAAYLISAGACVALIGFYVCHVLRSIRAGLGFTAGLAALYGALYGLLGAEDFALLLGAVLLFGLLGVFMVLTRKLDWYGVGKKTAAPQWEIADVQ